MCVQINSLQCVYNLTCSFKSRVPSSWGCSSRGGWWEACLLQEVQRQQHEAHANPAKDGHAWDQRRGHRIHRLRGVACRCKVKCNVWPIEETWKQMLWLETYHDVALLFFCQKKTKISLIILFCQSQHRKKVSHFFCVSLIWWKAAYQAECCWWGYHLE